MIIDRDYIRFISKHHFWLIRKYVAWMKKYSGILVAYVNLVDAYAAIQKDLCTYLQFFIHILEDILENVA